MWRVQTRRPAPATLAWLALLLPVLAAHLSYLISAADGLVPWCLPYTDGCSSISRAARHGLANPLFKALMLPYALVLALLWRAAARWLAQQAPTRVRRRHAVLACGLTGAAFLVLYVVFLGVEGPAYQWLRRYGITFYFAGTVLAQMLFTATALPYAEPASRRMLLALCSAMLLLGLASLPLQHWLQREGAVNAIEWCYALLMSLFFAPMARLLAR